MTGHENDHNCHNGCDGEEAMITLTLDDDGKLDCMVLAIFPIKKRQCIAFRPVRELEADKGDAYLYRFFRNPDGEPYLANS